MKIIKVTVLLLLVLFVTETNSQNFELGKVSNNELLERLHPEDTTAVAAVLYKKAKTIFKYNLSRGFTVNHEYTYRIKIYKKEGLSWANFEVPYFLAW